MKVDALLRATTRVWTLTLPCSVLRQLDMRSVRARNSSGPGRAMTERGLTGRSMTEDIREPLDLISVAESTPLDGPFTQSPRGWGTEPRPLFLNFTIYAPRRRLSRKVSARRSTATGDRREHRAAGGRTSVVPRGDQVGPVPN